MNNSLAISVVAITVIGVSACSGSNNTPPGTGAFRVVNAIPDSQPLDASINNVTSDIQNISYGSNSGIVDVIDGSYKVQISTSPAGGGSSVTYTVDNVSIDHNNQTTLYTIGTLGAQTNSGLAVERSIADVAADKADVQFVDAATASPSGTVYLVAPGTGIGAAVYSADLQSVAGTGNPPANPTSAYSQPTQVPQGTYEIIVTASNVPVYDSGPKGVAFAGGSSQQIAIMDATPAQITSNISPLQLLDLDNKSGGSTTLLAGAH